MRSYNPLVPLTRFELYHLIINKRLRYQKIEIQQQYSLSNISSKLRVYPQFPYWNRQHKLLRAGGGSSNNDNVAQPVVRMIW